MKGFMYTRAEPSLVSQLKCIENNSLLTKMERDEIEDEGGARQNRMVISRDEWDELFGKSDNDEEFLGFKIDNDMEYVSSLVDMGENYRCQEEFCCDGKTGCFGNESNKTDVNNVGDIEVVVE